MEWLLIKTILSLAAVLGLMFAMVYVMRRYMTMGRKGSSAKVDIEILGQRGLHPKRSVFVLRILGKVMVVGMSEAGLQTLGEIDDPDELARLEERDVEDAEAPRTNRWMTWAAGKGSGEGFAGQLSKYFNVESMAKAAKSPRKGRKSVEE